MYQAEYLRRDGEERGQSVVRQIRFMRQPTAVSGTSVSGRARIPDRPSPAIQRSANPSILIFRVHGNLACNQWHRSGFGTLHSVREMNITSQIANSGQCLTNVLLFDLHVIEVAQQFESGSSDPADQAGSVFLRAEKTGLIPVAWLRHKSDAVRFTSRQVVSVPQLIAALRLDLPPGKERDRQSWSVQMCLHLIRCFECRCALKRSRFHHRIW
jgi:hypothetical protein